MNTQDPIQKAENIIKHINHKAGKYTQPVFDRYPLLFMFLLTFGVTAIIEGMRFFLEDVHFFKEHPLVLLSIGILILLFTGTLYKKLEKVD
ncbi:MAG: hypothetical protein WC089_01335 [Candidatus Paceibacterota bacterium]